MAWSRSGDPGRLDHAAALEVTVTAPVTWFRNPLYSGAQVGLT
jgi:hypothetical protein